MGRPRRKDNRMEQYKTSRYNMYQDFKEGYGIIFNGLSKNISILSTEKIEIIKSEKYAELENSTLKKILELGYIVSKDFDEKQIIDIRFLQECFDSRLDLTIMPTEDCNFRCKYCYEHFKKGMMNEDVENGIFLYLKKNLRKYNALSVSWFGGEPTLAINLIEKMSKGFIELCHRLKIPYSAGITTNGYLLTEKNFNRLVKSRIRHFQVTLDGLEVYHDKFKRTVDNKSTYGTVLNNLISIKKNSPFRNFDITIRTNVSVEMLKDIENITFLYNKEFGDDKRFNFYFRPVGDWGGERVKKISESVFKKDLYSLVYSKLSEVNCKLNYRMYYLELKNNIDICYASRFNSYVIGMDGTIYKCTTIFEEECNKIGRISKEGNIELDEKKIAAWTMIGIKKEAICEDCGLLGNCHNATCVADQVRGKGTYNCPHLKNSFGDILKLVATNDEYVDYRED